MKGRSQTEREYLQVTYLIKDLYPEFIKDIPNSKIKTNNTDTKKMSKRFKHKEDMKMANKYVKRFSTS